MKEVGAREGKSAAKKAFVIMLVVELIVVLLIFLVTVLFKDGESTPSVFGYSFYISDMEKMDGAVTTDSLVVAKNGRPDSSVVGGVILCENVSGFDTGIFRVAGVESTAETFIYKVCLDSAPEDIFDIDAKNVIGECTYSYHTLGRMLLFVKSKIGVLVCVIIPALILAIIELILGFGKEMRKRELQKKRERVRREQEKDFSTKSHRSSSFSLDDFKNEEQALRNKHLKKNRSGSSRPKSYERTRRIDIREDRTRIIDTENERKSLEEKRQKERREQLKRERLMQQEADIIKEQPLAQGITEYPSEAQEKDSDGEMLAERIPVGGPAALAETEAADHGQSYSPSSFGCGDQPAAQDAPAEGFSADEATVTEVTAAEAAAASDDKAARSTSRQPMSLDEMMKLMEKQRERLKKDLQDSE